MDKKYLAFVFVAFIGLVACHKIFNKEKTLKPTVVSVGGVIQADSASVSVARDSNLRYVYLTFDDGPDAGTLNSYNTCKDKGVKATFFLVGEHANDRSRKHIMDTMRADMRHFLFANHSYTHANHNRYEGFYTNAQKALDDFLRVHDSLQLKDPIARFPGNNVWMVEEKTRATKLTRPLAKLMDSIGYNVLGWDVEWHYNRKGQPVQTAEAMAREVVEAFEKNTSLVKNHVVLLTHDRMFRDQNYKDSLAKMISILQSHKGYVFETADQYPKLKRSERSLIALRK